MHQFGNPNEPQRIKVKGGVRPMPERPHATNRLFTPGAIIPTLASPLGKAVGVSSIGKSRRAPINIHYDALKRSQIQGNPRLKISSKFQAGEQRQDFFREQNISNQILDPSKVVQYRTNPFTYQNTSKTFDQLPQFNTLNGRKQSRYDVKDQPATKENINKYLNGDIQTSYYKFQNGSNYLLGMGALGNDTTDTFDSRPKEERIEGPTPWSTFGSNPTPHNQF